MNVLGIETSTELAGAAVADGRGVRAESWTTGGRRHTETLAPAVDHVLAQCAMVLDEVDTIAVDVGPGLFTGLRVGLATAQGLALGLDVGVLPVSSLAVLAHAAGDAGWDASVLCVVDAKRSEVFVGRFGPAMVGRAEGPVELVRSTRCAPAEIPAMLGSGVLGTWSGERMLAVGDGASRYAAQLEPVDGLVTAGPSLDSPRPAALVALASRRLAAGAPTLAPGEVRPLYLRDPDARVNWRQRPPPAVAGKVGRHV